MSCCVCSGSLGKYGGNSAHPVAPGNARCCDGCNMSTVIFARMSAKKCKGRVDEGASQMFVTSTPTGSLIFFSPDKPDFHIKVTADLAEAAAGELHPVAVQSTYAGTEVKMRKDDEGCVHVRIDASENLAFWAEADII